MVKIEDATNSTIQEFQYNDNPLGNWPAAADGLGPSMEVVDVNGDYDLGTNWRASNNWGGTPGEHPEDEPPVAQPSRANSIWQLF